MPDMGQQDNYYSVENTIKLKRNNCYKVKKNQPMKTTTISIYKSLTLKGLQEGGRQKEFGLVLLKCQFANLSQMSISDNKQIQFSFETCRHEGKEISAFKDSSHFQHKEAALLHSNTLLYKKALLHTYWACKSDRCSKLYRLQQIYSAVFHKSTHCMVLKLSS